MLSRLGVDRKRFEAQPIQFIYYLPGMNIAFTDAFDAMEAREKFNQHGEIIVMLLVEHTSMDEGHPHPHG